MTYHPLLGLESIAIVAVLVLGVGACCRLIDGPGWWGRL